MIFNHNGDLKRDNRELLYAVSDELVQDLVDLMKEGRYPRFMEFLYVFCECNDNPIPANQNRIARILFVENGHILLPVVVGAKDITIDESIMVGLLGDIDVLMLLETTVLSVDQLHFQALLCGSIVEVPWGHCHLCLPSHRPQLWQL